MKLHGKATIILRDAKTGRIKFKESHSNDITPALSHILSENLAGTLDYTKILPLYSRVLGGVCLFNGNLDSTKVFLPKATEAYLVAHAGQTYNATYTQSDSKVGQPMFGTGQSEPISNGYRFVYNWSQTQGCGNITDLGLVHTDVGSFWNEELGNNLMADHFTPIERIDNGIIDPSEYEYQRYDVEYPHITNQKSIPLGFYDDTNTIVSAEYISAGTIRIHLAKFTGKGIWLWNSVGDVTEDQTYDIVAGTDKSNYIAYDHANKKVYIFVPDNTGDTEYYFRIKCLDLLTGNVTEKHYNAAEYLFRNEAVKARVKQQDGTPIPWTVAEFDVYIRTIQDPNCLKQVVIENGCIYLPLCWAHDQFSRGSTNCSLKVSLSNNAVYDLIENFYQYESGSNQRNQVQIDLGNDRFCNPQCMAWKNASGQYEAQEILYDDTNIFIYQGSSSRGYCARQSIDSPIQYLTYTGGTPSGFKGARGCMLNKMYLASAFRLDNPVQKTVTETMQVIYEIKQGEEAQT